MIIIIVYWSEQNTDGLTAFSHKQGLIILSLAIILQDQVTVLYMSEIWCSSMSKNFKESECYVESNV